MQSLQVYKVVFTSFASDKNSQHHVREFRRDAEGIKPKNSGCEGADGFSRIQVPSRLSPK